MSSSAPAAEGEVTPTQPESQKEPEKPGLREESEEEEDDDDEDDDEEEKEKSLIVEGKREKKKLERLTMQVSSLQREPFTIAQGKAQKLCEIERIHFFLSKKKTDELRNLHKLLYNRPGTVRPSVSTFNPSGKPLPKSKKSSSKGSKEERNSSGMARKAKRTKCPEILSDESSSDEDPKKNKEESSDDEDEDKAKRSCQKRHLKEKNPNRKLLLKVKNP
ncbi:Protein DEK [Tupaia chinensis]|uniref:Protein DEK n=1 Tax=Tupaia chinensis TaxID=246437 RepID=L8YGF8_TUPCH|nr:Protein DEK [Tupaia chinensis]